MILSVSHRSAFHYAQRVALARHVLHLTPRGTANQTCHRSDLTIEPAAAVSGRQLDFYNNTIHFVTIQQPHDELVLDATSLVEVTAPPPIDPAATAPWEEVRARMGRDLSADGLAAFEFTFDSPYTRTEADFAPFTGESFPPGRPILAGVLDLMHRIHAGFRYDGEATDLNTPLAEVYEKRHGVCQDFAHFQIACLRQLGLPARYVSGYLLTYPPAGKDKLIGADASHAWLSVWCPDIGWVDLDPTNDKIPAEEHITLAWGRDYGDVSPIRGVITGGADHTISVAVDVTPVEDDTVRPLG